GEQVVFPSGIQPNLIEVQRYDVPELGESMVIYQETASAAFVFRFLPKNTILLTPNVQAGDSYLVMFTDVIELIRAFRNRVLAARIAAKQAAETSAAETSAAETSAADEGGGE